MKNAWFKKWGWIHQPTNVIGWILSLLVLVFIIWVFVLVDRDSHSASDTLIGVFPWAWISLVTLNWIASKISNWFKAVRQFLTGTKFGNEKEKVQKPDRIPPQTPLAGGKKAELWQFQIPRKIVCPAESKLIFRIFVKKSSNFVQKNTAWTCSASPMRAALLIGRWLLFIEVRLARSPAAARLNAPAADH